jgi:hypothetical protein
MSKTQKVREILQRHERFAPADVAAEVGCTQPLVHHVIRDMRRHREFDAWYQGRKVTYRLLTTAEAAERRAEREKYRAAERRRQEVRALQQVLTTATEVFTAAIEDVRQRLGALAP